MIKLQKQFKLSKKVFAAIILRSIIVQYFLSHFYCPTRDEEQNWSFCRPETRWSDVGRPMIYKHPQMSHCLRNNCPRGEGGQSILKIEDIITVLIAFNDLSLIYQSARVYSHELTLFYISCRDNSSSLSSHILNAPREHVGFAKTIYDFNILIAQIWDIGFLIDYIAGQTPQSNLCHCLHVKFQVFLLIF